LTSTTTERDEGDISLVTGTRLSRETGALIVDFPTQATDKAIHAKISRTVTDIRNDDRRKEPVFNRFVLQAFDKLDSKKEVNQFKKLVKITVKYDPRAMAIRDERKLVMVYWDTAKKRWLPIQSFVDPKLKTVTGYTNHFTDFGLMESPDVASYLPNLKGFQTDLFTGAAGAGYDLQAPPGRGGLTPNLTLSYSSAGVDMMDGNQQSSFVGAGWNLGTSYIALDNRGTSTTDDDVFTLVLNGRGYDLVQDANDGTRYHTSDEQYWYITRIVAGNSWKVVTTDGTQYLFGSNTNGNSKAQRAVGNGPGTLEVYAWWLDTIQDTHTNQITYTYQHDFYTGQPCWFTTIPNFDMGIYPQTISYNGGLTQIQFTYSARTDWSWIINYCTPVPQQRLKLDRVDVLTSLTNPGTPQLVRRYAFGNDYSTFPGVVFDHGDGSYGSGRLTLKSLTQYGSDGTTALPAQIFSYSDANNTVINRLTQAQNGIGGKTTFAYEPTPVVAGALNPPLFEGYVVQWTPELYTCPSSFGWNGNGANTAGGFFDGFCFMQVQAVASPSYVYKSFGKFLPGTTYSYSANLGGSGGSAKLAAWDGVNEYPVTDWVTNIPGYGSITVGGQFTTNDRGGSLELRIYTQNNAPVRAVTLQIMNTRHRVATKTVNDGNGTVETYNYAYGGIAVNDAAHSDAAITLNPLKDAGIEFRGHEVVTVTIPSVSQTENHFWQKDFFVGRAITITQMDATSAIYAQTVNTYASMCIPVRNWLSSSQWQNPCTGATTIVTPTPTPTSTPMPTATDTPPPPPDPIEHGPGGYLVPASTPWAIASNENPVIPGKLVSFNWSESTNTAPMVAANIAPPLSPSSVPLDTVGIATGQKSYFIYLSSTERRTYDGATSYKSQKTLYAYTWISDTYPATTGTNLPASIQTQENDATGTPYRYTLQSYNLNTANMSPSVWIINKVNDGQVKDASTTLASHTQYFYDSTTSNAAALSKGELKRSDVYKDQGTYISTYYTYDGAGNVTSVTDPLTHPTYASYDPTYNIFPTSNTNALGQTITNTYNFLYGKLATTTDPNGAKSSYAYDPLGRTKQIWLPNEQTFAATAQYTYTLGSPTNPQSQVQVQVRNDLGGTNTAIYQSAWWFYDGLGRVIQKQTQAQNSTQIILANTSYTTTGQLYRASNPYTVTASGGAYQTPPTNWTGLSFTAHQYDAVGRETLTTLPDSTTQTMSYFQWTTTLLDAKNILHQNEADAFGRVITVSEFIQNQAYKTKYNYDSLNHLRFVTDTLTNQTEMRYDWLGRKTFMTDPDMGIWTYGYDNAGNLTQQTDAKHQRTCFYYDAGNRLLGKNYQTDSGACPASAGSYSVTNIYDSTSSGNKGIGRRTGLSDASGSTSWVYDSEGRVLTQKNSINGAPQAYTTQWSYDALSRARSMVYPDGENVALNYNTQGLLATLSGYVTGSNYSASSQLTSLTLGSGATTTYAYNQQNLRLTNLTTSSNLQNLGYTYDAVGNVQTISDTVRGETSQFTYDDLNRLLSVNLTGGSSPYSQGWTYNAIGNILTRTGTDAATYSYNPTQRPHAATQMGSLYYCYDANGNMTRRALTDPNGCSTGSDNLIYDNENRLTRAISGTVTSNFAYNGDGARVMRSDGTTTTYYVGNHYEVSVTGGVTTTTKYYYFGAQRVAMRTSAGVTYLHSDHLGSTSVASDQNGAFLSRQTYFAFGVPRSTDGSALPTDFTFTGQKLDQSDGLMYYGARYYDAVLGRFISADTIVPSAGNPQSLNRYAYTLNNPVKYVDPSGHCPLGEAGCERDTKGNVIIQDRGYVGESRERNYWTRPTKEQAFAAYYAKLCGDVCAITIEHSPPILNDIGMLIADDGGSFGGVVYRNLLTPEEQEEARLQMIFVAAIGSVTPVKGVKGSSYSGGEFSIVDWEGYPTGTPKPSGPFRIITNPEYQSNRNAANATNNAMHKTDPDLTGLQVHEIQPVKFGGSPTDLDNKIALPPPEHYVLNSWWNDFLRRFLGQ